MTSIVTPAQIKFLRLLHERGPLTALNIAGEIEKSIQYTHAIIRELREGGLIEKTLEGIDVSEDKKTLAWRYKLSVPLESIGIKPQRIPSRIPDTEILYAAILRSSGMTGRELQDQFREIYPHRSKKTILASIIPNARHRGWCR